MKVKFSKDGITINSKKIDPLNFSIGGYGVKWDIEQNKKDPYEILEALASIKKGKNTKENKIETLKSIVDK
ncbi:MAG: hypothetical protein MJA82_02600 [Clostridia bacterium]|nr:hypothetical protein [Clostridia bacterium]